MLLDTATHYYNYQETGGFQPGLSISPPPSPFSDNYFAFPPSASEHGQWAPSYHGYSAQSPLLSASASEIPETVRYSGLSHCQHSQLQEMGYGLHEAFGHDLGFSQAASLYSSNSNTNYQVTTVMTVSLEQTSAPPSSSGPAVVGVTSRALFSRPGQQ